MEILVTGGANGIGKATVERLLEKGHSVKVIDTDRESLDSLPNEVGKHEEDITDPEIAETVDEIEFDVLINCAGFQRQGSVEDMSVETFEQHLDVNYLGTLRMVKAAIPELKRKEGRIINVSSVAGKATMPFLGAYSASKYAVEGFSDALRMELKDFDVEVVLIEPGSIETGFNHRAVEALNKYMPDSDYADGYRRRLESDGFRGAKPEKVAEKTVRAVESSSPKARYTVTWQALVITKLKYFIPTNIYDRLARRI